MAGYSGTPLAKKLGIEPGCRVGVVTAPEGIASLLEPLPADVQLVTEPNETVDVALVFAVWRADMEERFRSAMQRISADGTIWVAWPKRRSGVETDLTEDTMRELFLPTGMVDNKVAAIDETWSGLRFVVRKENREAWEEPAG